MSRAKLSPTILDYLIERTGLEKSTIRSAISRLRHKFARCTPNAVAHIYAQSKGYTVWQKLSKEDRESLPHIEAKEQTVNIKRKQSSVKEKLVKVIDYETDDYFKKGHVTEVNRAYSNGCYTSVHILARKIIENLIREILSERFPPTTKDNKELYFDISQNRFKDFSVILRNLYDKRNEFEPEKIKIIERLYQQAKEFKDDANDATHSWYSLIQTKKEIDDLNLQSMIELIKSLAK